METAVTYRWPQKLDTCFQCERRLKRMIDGQWAHVWTDPLTGKHDLRKNRAEMRAIDRDDHDPDPTYDTAIYTHGNPRNDVPPTPRDRAGRFITHA